jgi:putative ABC transport system permease protein
MLELKSIKKAYYVGDQTVEALRGVNLKFRKNEFVSILGPSGCGKTTTLNIIGGLDRYTSGDLLIDNKSTKNFKDQDWDAYRNSTIGFVFQNYNLISHLTVLDNVEMALSLSGVKQSERKLRATKVLEDVGLADQLYKKPNQLSGGQMQRVAIARALVNNPKILLADEPTGALDSKTSKQIMKLIKDISKERLVIMVTHNSKIAEQYSDRLIRLLDGEVIDDTNGVKDYDSKILDTLSNRKTSMSYYQAIRTSFKNLFTKKGRTMITAIAGSIGIIGVALVFGISAGMTEYIDDMQGDTLAGFPITVNEYVQTTIRNDSPGNGFMESDDPSFPDGNMIYLSDPSEDVELHQNIITEDYIDYLNNMDASYYSSISYTSAVAINVVNENANGTYQLTTLESSGFDFFTSSIFNELPNNQEFVETQYDVLAGTYPDAFNELVLVVGNENELDISIIEALGYNVEDEYTFEDFLGKEFKVIPNDVFYTEIMGLYLPSNDYQSMYNDEEAISITITGILRVNEDATSEILSTGIAYTSELTATILENAETSEIVIAQAEDDTINILTGQPFNEQLTYETVMQLIGGDSMPVGIEIYPTTYESKDLIKAYLDDYNVGLLDDNQIIYTDLAELISSTISALIDTITIVLAAFAGISLVVSSIMIGIITYVSVIERTKEIGIMRSLGARKKDISRIFNAETLLIGLTSGILGIGVYFLLQGPINIIINSLIGVESFAGLPMYYAIGLIILSSILTLVAGLIPSRIAAKKDPVIALRTE